MTTPFCCTAVDLEQKKEVIFTQGSLFEALRASSAYPPILSPIFYQDKYLVDGGIIDNVPAIAARQMEKTHSIDNGKIVAFKINNNIIRQHIAGHIFIKHYRKPSFLERFNIFKRKMEDLKLLGDLIMEIVTIASEQHVIKNLAQAKPEILFEPIIDVGLTNFSQLEPQIALGRKIALDNLEKIKNLQLSNQTI
jgi:NTE family protein